MNIDKAIQILKNEYEKAKKKRYIIKPLAFALYQTWKTVDKKEKARNVDD